MKVPCNVDEYYRVFPIVPSGRKTYYAHDYEVPDEIGTAFVKAWEEFCQAAKAFDKAIDGQNPKEYDL